MREELAGFHKISIYGTRQEIDHAKLWLITLPLTEVESTDRLLIQDCIDAHKLKASILYSGNTVRPYRKVIEEYKKVLKNGIQSLSDYLYKFFSLQRTIAHYDRMGWLTVYNSVEDIKDMIQKGTSPGWKTDVVRIRQGLLSL